MLSFKSAGKYNTIKERKYKFATVVVFIITAVVYIMFCLLMIATKFQILSPLIKFHDSVVYSRNANGEIEIESKYNSEYIKEQLQELYETKPELILDSTYALSFLIILMQGVYIFASRKNGKFMFVKSVAAVMIYGIITGALIIAVLFVWLWAVGFDSLPEIGSLIEPSNIYGWLFLLPLLMLDAWFVWVYSKAAYYEVNVNFKDR